MSTDDDRLAKFNPSRFGGGKEATLKRKGVRWPDDPQEEVALTVPSSAPNSSPLSSTPAASPPRWLATAKWLASFFPVFIIAVYLLVRDGWFTLLASHISLKTSRLGPPTSWYRLIPSSPAIAYITPDLERHINDRITQLLKGPVLLRDFALLADGALVDEELTTQSAIHPTLALTDDNRIGNCWHVPSSHGQLGIVLPSFIYPTSVTVDHIPVELAADPGVAPARMVLWGVIDGDRNEQLLVDHQILLRVGEQPQAPPWTGRNVANFVVLANFTYDIQSPSPIQTFPVRPIFRELTLDFGLVILEIVDNWGSASTCIYRVRVHGDPSS